MGKLTGWIVVLLLVATPASAQVAVPEIIPGAPRLLSTRFDLFPQASFTPENPAALRWGSPSRIGGGTINGKSTDSSDILSSDLSGAFGGFRLVGNHIGIAIEQVSYKLEQSLLPVEKEASSFALAFSYPDWLAIGISAENRTAIRTPLTGTETDEVGSATLGLSLNISDLLFIGYALSDESRTREILGIKTSTSRPVSMAGLGLRGGGGLIWHLEISAITKDPFTGNPDIKEEGYDHTQAVLELAFWNMIMTIAGYDIKGTGTADNVSVEGYTADFGLAPLQGLVLTGRLERSRLFVDNIENIQDDAKYFTLGWQF